MDSFHSAIDKGYYLYNDFMMKEVFANLITVLGGVSNRDDFDRAMNKRWSEEGSGEGSGGPGRVTRRFQVPPPEPPPCPEVLTIVKFSVFTEKLESDLVMLIDFFRSRAV